MPSVLDKKSKIKKPEGPEFYISKKVGRAIIDYNMLCEGDKIAVAVSGGKDSMTLLKVVHDRQSFVPIKYDLLAVHVDLGYCLSHTKTLEKYFKKNGYNYCIEKVNILKNSKRDVNCFWCSWNRRKALFQTANRLGCNKVALGHHKDDIIETFFINICYAGVLSTMRPALPLFNGQLTIIRPLSFVDEDRIIRYARSQGFPEFINPCPSAVSSKRSEIKTLLKELYLKNQHIKGNIFRSLRHFNPDYLL